MNGRNKLINFKGNNDKNIVMQNVKRYPTGVYGGVLTQLKKLKVGTKFFVHNGFWFGEIISRNGIKCLLMKGSKIEISRKIKDNDILIISILKNFPRSL